MTRKEAIEMLCAYGVPQDVDKFQEALDMAIRALAQELTLDKIQADINKLTVFYTTKDKEINLISQRAVNRVFERYKAESEDVERKIIRDIYML